MKVSMRKVPWITLSLTAVAVGLYAWTGTVETLIYNRSSPCSMTVLTSHFVHWSWDHLFYDALMFVLLGSWCEYIDRHRYALFLFIGAMGIPPLATWLTPSIQQLAGLSGLTMGQGAFGVTATVSRIKDKNLRFIIPIGLVGVATLGKLFFELLSGTNLFVETGSFESVPAAHLVGAGLGVLIGIKKNTYGFGRLLQFAPVIRYAPNDLEPCQGIAPLQLIAKQRKPKGLTEDGGHGSSEAYFC